VSTPPEGCHPTPFYISDLVSPLFFVSLPTIFFLRVSPPPWRMSPGAVHPLVTLLLFSNKKTQLLTHGSNFITTQQIINFTVLWVCVVSSRLRIRLLTRSTVSAVQVLRSPLQSMSLLTVPESTNFFSSLLMLLFCPAYAWKFIR